MVVYSGEKGIIFYMQNNGVAIPINFEKNFYRKEKYLHIEKMSVKSVRREKLKGEIIYF